MNAYAQARKYQDALNRKDLAGILSLFTSDATVKTPIYGVSGVQEFHERVFALQKQSIARLTNVFDGRTKANSIALQFSYTWVLNSGEVFAFDGVSIFELDDSSRKIARLNVIYDSTELRKHLNQTQIESVCLG
jgi:nuclear transport factor 2 (NTF2) superfamily protein